MVSQNFPNFFANFPPNLTNFPEWRRSHHTFAGLVASLTYIICIFSHGQMQYNFFGPGVLACATRGGGRSEAGHCFHLLFATRGPEESPVGRPSGIII